MSLRSLTAAACGAAAGLGVWATLGSIDRMQAPSGAVRVAMLPSVGTLVLSVTVGAILFVAWHLAVKALARRAGARESDAIALAPLRVLAGGALLVLPFLPWIADALPATMLLAGSRQPAGMGHPRRARRVGAGDRMAQRDPTCW